MAGVQPFFSKLFLNLRADLYSAHDPVCNSTGGLKSAAG
jgi:hypothetical protein